MSSAATAKRFGRPVTGISAASSGASWAPSRRAGRRRSAVTSSSAMIAAPHASPTTPAATAIAPSARGWRAPNGSRIDRPNCCRCRTSTSSSPCQRWRARSPSRTRPPSMRSCSALPLRRSPPSPPIPRHLGAQIGVTAVLHTWGQTLQHHPHIHCVVPGGGPSLDGTRWIACRPGFFLPVRVLSRLFRRLFLQNLQDAFDAGKLALFRQPRRSCRAHGLRHRARPTQTHRMGRLCQAAVRWPRTGAGLSRPLHPSRRHRQQPAGLALRRQGPLRLEGLSPRRARPR